MHKGDRNSYANLASRQLCLNCIVQKVVVCFSDWFVLVTFEPVLVLGHRICAKVNPCVYHKTITLCIRRTLLGFNGFPIHIYS